MASTTAEAVGPLGRPVELSFPLPKAPDIRVYLRLTIQSTSILLFLTTAMNGDTSTATPLGSFVYALPDVRSYCIPSYRNLLLIPSIESQSRPDNLNSSLHLRVFHRVHHPFSEATRTENRKTSLCGQFHKLFKRWTGRYGRGGNGRIQEGRRGHYG